MHDSIRFDARARAFPEPRARKGSTRFCFHARVRLTMRRATRPSVVFERAQPWRTPTPTTRDGDARRRARI